MLPILGGIISGLMGSSASRSAANTQANSAQAQLDFNKQVYADQTAQFAPWQEMGMQGQQAYNSLLGLGSAPSGFNSAVAAPNGANYQQSPGYQFQMDQGLDAAQSSAYARGGGLSGRTLTDLNNYAQGVANQDYNGYMDRATNDYQTYLNRLQGVGQMGQASAGMQASAAGNYGTNGMNAIGSMGDARAAGTVGSANAWTSGINNAIAGLGYMQANGQNFWGQPQGGQTPQGPMQPGNVWR